MKVLILCGTNPNQVALANKVAAEFTVVGIVAEQRPAKPNTKKMLFEKILDKTLFRNISAAWALLMDFYRSRYPDFPHTEILRTPSVNTDEVKAFIEKLQPDVIMVSGTSLVRKKILEIPLPLGMLNLHTGLSPYIKGGPNCTNWCISTRQFHLIGNTIMFIDAGIDSGDIIATEIVRFSGKESLAEMHRMVMEDAHELYLKVLRKFQQSPASVKKVKQSTITEGKTFYSKEWNYQAKLNHLRNLKHFQADVQSPAYEQKIAQVTTVNI
jgi:methionyl-tRNA formyltransferase